MKILRTLLVAFIGILGSSSVWAEGDNGPIAEEKVPLDVFETENAYIFESDLKYHGTSIKQDSLQNDFSYAHRFQITGHLYLRAGLAYDRFDFGETAAPVPTHLQSTAGVISLDYMKGADTGAMLEFKPGFYTEDDFDSDSFDCPITAYRIFILQPDKLYGLLGVGYSFLRETWGGFVPIVGLVWIPNEQWKVMAVPPEPKIIYTVNKQLHLYAGGEVEGGSFRTDDHNSYQNNGFLNQFNHEVIDYVDYRADAGVTWTPTDQIEVDLGGGISVQRELDFHRIDEHFRSDPAPFVRLELKAKF